LTTWVKAVHIINGNTFVVNPFLRLRRIAGDGVRAAEYDCPEIGEPGREKIRGRVEELILYHDIELKNLGEVELGVLACDVYPEGRRCRMKESVPRQADMVSAREAAAILGVTVQTIKNYIYRGKIRSYKTPGGHHRIRREDIRNLGPLEDSPSREEVIENYNELYQGYIDTLHALTNALDARDGIVSGHSRRVADCASSIARSLGLSQEEMRLIELSGLLHDVGKIMISEHILGKPGRLTDQELYLIKQHPVMGERIVESVGFLRDTGPLVRHHHERFDGKGYPDGLEGEKIPLQARILFVAETFDCLRSDSSFHEGLPLDRSIDVIRREADTQFDPDIVKTFLDSLNLSGG
jgi:excisionase family DNA binding protein/putative nucleotidyltransferase with HDIG domain